MKSGGEDSEVSFVYKKLAERNQTQKKFSSCLRKKSFFMNRKLSPLYSSAFTRFIDFRL